MLSSSSSRSSSRSSLRRGTDCLLSGGGLPQEASEGATKGLGDMGKTGGEGGRKSVLAGEYGREGGKGESSARMEAPGVGLATDCAA